MPGNRSIPFLAAAGVCLALVAGRAARDFTASHAQEAPFQGIDLTLVAFASGFNDPVGIVNAGTPDSRLFVVERQGVIRILKPDGTTLPTPFLDIRTRVNATDTEQGLLGLAFHPDYAKNGAFFVNYTHTDGGVTRTRVSRFHVTSDPNLADPVQEDILLTVDQPYSNHNAGDLHFGLDGYLYIPLGDGGSGGDPQNNSQNPHNLLGSIVRIDVDAGTGSSPDCPGLGGGYKVPGDNPFVDGPGGAACDEVWAYGLRNPWRFSFDRATGDLYLGDVGQNNWEEVDFQPDSSTGGENYGWRCYEGNHVYKTSGCQSPETYTFPVLEYPSSGGNCSVIGGYVYRGGRFPAMYGHYFLADYCSGSVWDLVFEAGNWTATQHTQFTRFGYAAFGEDAAGELYLVNTATGVVYRLEAQAVYTEWVFLPLIWENGGG